MSFIMPRGGFQYITGNVLTTRPVAAFGTSITPAQNTMGSYTEILSDTLVTKDCYGIKINVNSIFQSAGATDSLTTIGIDTAGGTSYVDLIPNLLTSCADAHTEGYGGAWYYFPLYIPAGSAIAAKGSINNGTVGTQNVAVWLYGAPNNPAALQVGQGVEALGITAASSSGTPVTPGTTNDGAWTSLGAPTKCCFAWQYGMGINDSTMGSGGNYNNDLSYGDGTNQVMIDMDKRYLIYTTTEKMGHQLVPPAYCLVPPGTNVYGRSQCSGTADSNVSMAAYGVY